MSLLLTPEQAAEQLGVKPGTLEAWRTHRRYALRYIKIGRLVRYRPEDIEEFLRSRTVSGDAKPIALPTGRAKRPRRLRSA